MPDAPSVTRMLGRLWGAIDTAIFGNHESYWVAYYTIFERLGVQFSPATSTLLGEWACLCQASGWIFPYREVCLVADRPAAEDANSARQKGAFPSGVLPCIA